MQKRLITDLFKRCLPKRIVLILFVLCFTAVGNAQFYSAELQAAGLTCAMCSNAIHKSLKKLNFIKVVEVDLKSSSFTLLFQESAFIDFDAIRNKVEDAGFSVSSLTVKANIPQTVEFNNSALLINKVWICFVDDKEQQVRGDVNFRIIEKGFVPDKVFAKYKKNIQSSVCAGAATLKPMHVVRIK